MPVSNVPEKKETNGNFPPLDPPPQESQIVREITLTDKLNKKLLESFLVHLNQTSLQPSTSEAIEDTSQDFA